MKRPLLVLLASVFFTAFASNRPSSLTLPDQPPVFREVHSETFSGYQIDLPGKQVRFLPDGLVSVAEYRRLGRPEPDLSAPLTSPALSEYEVMVWNWDWHHDADVQPQFDQINNQIIYPNLKPGIDLVYYLAGEQQLKYDLIVQPGADPSAIRASLDGATFEKVDRKGRLLVTTPWGKSRDEAPLTFAKTEGLTQEVPSAYLIDESGNLRFSVEYNEAETEELVIDPLTMTWTTFHHSAYSDDYVIAITRDAANFMYVAGYTETPTFPVTSGVFQGTFGGQVDAFVSKLAPSGNYLVWSTFLGGSDWDMAYAIDIDASGRIYVGGYTASADFPVTFGAVQPGMEGLNDAFIVCLDPNTATAEYSTFLGGTDRDYLYDLVCSPSGDVYVTGYTFSNNFPTTAGSFDPVYNGYGDSYLAGISAGGSSLLFSTYLGGTGFDMAQALDRADDGTIAVVGNTNSLDLPLSLPIQSALNLGGGNATDDGFFLRLNASGSALINGTYYGGSGSDGLYAVEASSSGDWFVFGNTYSTDLLTTPSAYQTSYQGNGDVFVARLGVGATSVAYSTYIGGTDVDYAKAIRVEDDEEVYLLGASRSTNWPVTGGLFSHSGQYDAYLTHLTADGSAINSSTLMGGSYNDYPRAASSLHLTGNLLALAVTTHSPNVQSAGNGYQKAKLNGLSDAPWLVGFEGDVLLPPGEFPSLNELDEEKEEFLVLGDGEFWTWQYLGEEAGPVELSILDMSGRLVSRESHAELAGMLPVDALPSGMYVIRASLPGGKFFVSRIVRR